MTVQENYRVKLEAFEGPLDLLLHLVRKNEVDIYDLPIATITDQYLAYVSMFEELNLNVAGEYLLMAASLMYMKSRLLLPADEDAEEDEENPVEDLVRQLAEYQRYREAAEALRDRALLDRDVFRREPSPPPHDDDEEGVEFRKVELADLFDALRGVLEGAKARRPHTVARDEYSVADAVRAMVDRLCAVERLEFFELFEEGTDRGLVIATFVGLLELIKWGIIEAEQRVGEPAIYLRMIEHDIDASIVSLTEMYGAGAASGATEPQEGPE